MKTEITGTQGFGEQLFSPESSFLSYITLDLIVSRDDICTLDKFGKIVF